MLRVYLDVETLPPERDDPLVGEKIARCSDEEYRRLALDGEFGRLLCVGLIVEENNGVKHRGILGRDKNTGKFHLDEARTLRAFWKLIQNFDSRRDLFVGFNLLDFDLPFIRQRSIIHRVKPSISLCFARFRSQPVFDIMWEFSSWRHRHKLDDLARVLGIESSKRDGVDGSTVYDLFLAGRHQEIADYCLRDVELTRMMYRRLNFIE
jgi:hypothetical protein